MQQLRKLSALMLVSLLVAACSKAPAPQRPVSDPAAANGATAIKVAIYERSPDRQILDPLIAAYRDRYPDRRVEVVEFPYAQGAGATVVDRVRGGAIDLISSQMPLVDLANQGLLADLDARVQSDGFALTPFEPEIDALRLDGKLLSIPVAAKPWVLAYNADRARIAGVTIPSDQWTWEAFRKAALRMTLSEGGKQIWGFDSGLHELFADLRVVEATRPPVKQPLNVAVRETLDLFRTMIFMDKSMPPGVNASGKSLHISFSTDDPFFHGKAGMTLAPLDAVAHMSALPFAWDVAPMPTIPGSRPAVMVDATAFALAKQGQNQDAAWDFLKFMAGPDGAAALARKGIMPFRQDPTARSLYFTETYGMPPGAASLADASWVIRFGAPKNNVAFVAWLEAASPVMSGATTVEAAMATFAEKIK